MDSMRDVLARTPANRTCATACATPRSPLRQRGDCGVDFRGASAGFSHRERLLFPAAGAFRFWRGPLVPALLPRVAALILGNGRHRKAVVESADMRETDRQFAGSIPETYDRVV